MKFEGIKQSMLTIGYRLKETPIERLLSIGVWCYAILLIKT